METDNVTAMKTTSMTENWPTDPRASQATAEALGLYRFLKHLSKWKL
jgi:hypothetical protein